jgi:hypothetical protein
MKKNTMIVIFIVAALVIGSFFAFYPLDIYQKTKDQKWLMLGTGLWEMGAYYAQDITTSSINNYIHDWSVWVRWERTGGGVTPTIRTYFCTESQYDSWNGIGFNSEGEYTKSKDFTVSTMNQDIELKMSIEMSVSTSTKYFIIVRPIVLNQEQQSDLYILGSDSNPFPYGKMRQKTDYNSHWLIHDTKDLAFYTKVSIYTPPNNPPIASYKPAGGSYPVNTVLTLDASGSSDPDGDALTYSWKVGSGSWTTPSSTKTYSVTFGTIGTIPVDLKVSDGKAESTKSNNFVITEPDGSYSIKVYTKDSKGTSIPSASISITGAKQESGDSDSSGYREFTDMPSGSYTVTVTKPGYQSWSDSPTITNSGITVTSANTLETGDSLKITVRTLADQTAISGASVLVNSVTKVTTQTGEATFLCSEVPRGSSYDYSVSKEGFETVTGKIPVGSTGTTNTELYLGVGGGGFDFMEYIYLIIGIIILAITLPIGLLIPNLIAKVIIILGITVFVIMLLLQGI